MVTSAVEIGINNAVSNLIVGGSRMSPQTFKIMTNCFASICYHYDYLDRNLHPRSRVRQAPLYQQCKDEWKALSVISYPWSTTRNSPKLTGIPPHVVLLSELHTISRQVESFKNDFREVLKTELDTRELGGGDFYV